ncbi:MAG: hypothetical protein K8R87_02225 [Verrucomicrobia bacterium]|nr:hypothetical protein [Verrucomicrobiota bacterium]
MITPEQKSKIAQGLFFGLLFLFLGNFIKGCAGEYKTVKYGGEFGMIMGGVIIAWGLWHCFSKPK